MLAPVTCIVAAAAAAAAAAVCANHICSCRACSGCCVCGPCCCAHQPLTAAQRRHTITARQQERTGGKTAAHSGLAAMLCFTRRSASLSLRMDAYQLSKSKQVENSSPLACACSHPPDALPHALVRMDSRFSSARQQGELVPAQQPIARNGKSTPELCLLYCWTRAGSVQVDC
jgi:hypothetical protein